MAKKRIKSKADDDHESNTAPNNEQSSLTCFPCQRSTGTYRDNSEDVSNDKRRDANKYRKKHHLAALPTTAKHVQEWKDKSNKNEDTGATK